MQHRILADSWTIAPTAGTTAPGVDHPVAAAVPGCVHTDLLAAGLIEDPYLDANETALRWMHDVDWRYERPLALDPAGVGERVDLVFDGIDTVATVAWAGRVVGRTANMHRSYRFDVRELADGAEHPLTVDLR